MMSKEEKAIDMLEKFITEHKLYNIKQSNGLEESLEILLDLYNEQKERLKELEEIEKEHKKQNGELQERVKFCKVHNLPEDVESIVFYKEDFERNFGNDFISKEKIKAKIKELEQIKNTALTDRTVEMMNDKIDILQLIMEE